MDGSLSRSMLREAMRAGRSSRDHGTRQCATANTRGCCMTKLKYPFLICLLLIVLTGMILTGNVISSQRPTPASVGLPTWEYRVVTVQGDAPSADGLPNSLAVQGFELANFEVTRFENSNAF